MAEQRRRGSFLQFALIFAVVYLGSQFVLRQFFPEQFGGQGPREAGVYLSMQDASVRFGNDPVVVIENATQAAVTLPVHCPQPPFDVYRISEAGTVTPVDLGSADTAGDCPDSPVEIAPGARVTYSLAPWKYSVFGENATYELRLTGVAGQSATGSSAVSGSGAALVAPTASGRVMAPADAGEDADQAGDALTVRFEVYEPGVFTKLFRTFVSRPLLNALVFIGSVVPGHNLGLAIIILTLIVKLILFIPTQHALEGQKKMQILQPKMEALKKQYAGNPQKIQEETMKLWKQEKVNPMQSCLPMLIQFPILIGLFYVVRDGVNLQLSQHLLYSVYENLNWSFGTSFLGLDLLRPNIWFMPAFLMVMQFAQMKLTFAIAERKKRKKDGIIDVPSAKEIEREIKNAPTDPEAAQKLQQNMMLYGLPILIAVMAVQFPAAVSLYWAIQTIFGIGQQLVVNRRTA